MYKNKPFVANRFIIRYINMKRLKTLFVLVFLLVSTQVTFAMTVGESTTSSASAVACTMDVKLCPDGVTYVGRTGPSCEFAKCPSVPVVCTDLKYNLKVGSTDATTSGEVTKLQAFLFPKYLKVESTGRLLGLTRAASVEFQKQYGISPAYGYVGPLTRAKIKELTCGGTSEKLSIESVFPTVAKVGQTVSLNGPGLNSGGDYILFDGYRIETDKTKGLNYLGFVVPEHLTNTINCIKAPCPLGLVKMVVPGVYTVQVVNNLGSTNVIKLEITDKDVISPSNQVKISSVQPQSAKVKQVVTIFGYNLFRPETRILFNGMSIPGKPVYTRQVGSFDSALEFVVPEFLSYTINCITTPCPQPPVKQVLPGTYELAVDNKLGRDAVKFEVLGDVVSGKPYLSSLSPIQGVVGAEVYIFGEKLNTGSEKIYFAGSIVESTTLATDRKGMLRFKVPGYITPCGYEEGVACRMVAQSVTPGKYDVVVKNASGLSNTLSFTVTTTGTTIAPKINSLTPSAEVIGTEVVIKGEGINIGGDEIYFGGSLVSPLLSVSADVVNTLRFKVPTTITPCGVGGQNLCRIASQSVVPGKYDVVVKNASGISNALSFTVKDASDITLAITNFYTTEYTFTNGNATSVGRKLIWTTTGAQNCYAYGAWSGQQSVNGEYALGFMSQPLSYTLTCYNEKGVSVSKTITDSGISTTQTPSISMINPVSGATGIQVTLSGSNFNPASDFIWFGGLKFAPNRTTGSANSLVFNVPTTLFECSVKSGEVCLATYQPTPLGYHPIKIESVNGKVSNVINYQVTSNGSTSEI